MDQFFFFLKYGFFHIVDYAAYDHILFLIALCAIYTLADWKAVLWMVTAFTIGHSVTLILATMNLIILSSELVGRLIPLTILLSSFSNIFLPAKTNAKKSTGSVVKYLVACFFGLIHGLAFSNNLRSMIMPGEGFWKQLLAFNIGIELGQIVVVAFILLLAYLFVEKFKARKREWALVLSGMALGVSLLLILGIDV